MVTVLSPSLCNPHSQWLLRICRLAPVYRKIRRTTLSLYFCLCGSAVPGGISWNLLPFIWFSRISHVMFHSFIKLTVCVHIREEEGIGNVRLFNHELQLHVSRFSLTDWYIPSSDAMRRNKKFGTTRCSCVDGKNWQWLTSGNTILGDFRHIGVGCETDWATLHEGDQGYWLWTKWWNKDESLEIVDG